MTDFQNTAETYEKQYQDVIDKMEIQASVMAPVLLMPRKALIEYTNPFP